jgi:hypothetical protein
MEGLQYFDKLNTRFGLMIYEFRRGNAKYFGADMENNNRARYSSRSTQVVLIFEYLLRCWGDWGWAEIPYTQSGINGKLLSRFEGLCAG